MRTTVSRRTVLVVMIAASAARPADCAGTKTSKESGGGKPAVLFLFWNTGHRGHRYTKRYLADLEQRGFAVSMA